VSEPLAERPAAAQPPRKGWWGRHWMWVVLVGCLAPIVLCGGCFATIFFGVFGAIKSSDVYQEALAKARASDEVQAALGQPIEAGFFVTGSIEVSGATGNADLAIPISGPNGSATVYAVANRSAGRWSFTTLEVEVQGAASRIDLMSETDP